MSRLFLPLYALLALFLLLFMGGFEAAIYQFAPRQAEEDAIADLEGGFYMIEELLLLSPREQWPQRLNRMSSRNIPVRVVRSADLPLSGDQRQRLQAGELLVYDLENKVLLKQLANSGELIQVGPVATVEGLGQATAWLFLAGATLLMLLVGIWALQIQWRMTRLGRVARQFGQGQLDARASTSVFVSVGQLNLEFNRMADRVEHLVDSHKQLVNAVSHELRTPIARIRFELDYAQGLTDPEQLHGSCDSIAEDIAELESLVDELLCYARYDRQAMALQLASRDPSLWLKEWHEAFRPLRSDVSITLDIAAAESGWYADFDAAAMNRVMNNLVQNACRYARQAVEIRLWADSRGLVHICVDDDGDGIPHSMRESLFQPFVRGDRSRNRDTGGVGLGLAIVDRIVRLHGGQLLIEDAPAGGARLHFWW